MGANLGLRPIAVRVAAALALGCGAVPPALADELGPELMVPSPGLVPPRPTLWVPVRERWNPSLRDRRVTVEDEHGQPIAFEAIGSATWMDGAFRKGIRVSADAGSFTVRIGERWDWSGTYTVDPIATRPPAAPAQIVSLMLVRDGMPCVTVGTRVDATMALDAPVYRLEWSRSREDYRAGQRETTLATTSGGPLELRRGTFLGQGADGAIYLGVATIWPDGTEIAAPDTPTLVVFPAERLVLDIGTPAMPRVAPEERDAVPDLRGAWSGAPPGLLAAATALDAGRGYGKLLVVLGLAALVLLMLSRRRTLKKRLSGEDDGVGQGDDDDGGGPSGPN